MTPIPRYRVQGGLPLLSAGFRPFFLAGSIWACVAVPVWLLVYSGAVEMPNALPPVVWHAHEMIYGFAAAVVAGFLLTAIPNWTGRMPLQSGPLGLLVLLWLAGRVAVLLSAELGAAAAAGLDLLFPAVFLAVIAREILAGRNWRNLPMLVVLGSLLLGNALVHVQALGLAETASFGNQFGIATLLMLISLVAGRIVPSFTRNWLAKHRPDVPAPATFGRFDRCVMAITPLALAGWLVLPESRLTALVALAAGIAHLLRLARWRGLATLREPLLWVLHLGYAWVGIGFCLVGLNGWLEWVPPTAALHAFTVGAVGTMTLAVMTRATLGHTGRALTAGAGTTTIYALVSLATLVRLLAPLCGANYLLALSVAGMAWSGAFGLFALLYARPLALPRLSRAMAPLPTPP
jgi:uncharacterized protein involved in response to NO